MTDSNVRFLELPERRSLATVIFERLEQMILSGALKPGEPINEKALSDRNGLSRAPIREAVRRLEQAGLVETIVNRGAYVKKISPQSAADLCDIRVVLAVHAARLAVDRITKAQIVALKRTMRAIEAAASEGRLPDFYRLNYGFHMTIIEAAGNRRLSEIYTAINKELNLYRWRALKGADELDEAITAHRTIVAALASRDTERFIIAVEEHLRAANQRLLQTGIADDL
jgi:DNA-binding GntR family transcriptional regulator